MAAAAGHRPDPAGHVGAGVGAVPQEREDQPMTVGGLDWKADCGGIGLYASTSSSVTESCRLCG